jgi:hypothetical protein
MPWPIFSISSISDLESFRKAIFYYQKIRRKILRRLHYELTARPYAPPSFVGEQKNVQNLCNNRIFILYPPSGFIIFFVKSSTWTIAFFGYKYHMNNYVVFKFNSMFYFFC